MNQATTFWGSNTQSATDGATVASSLLRLVDAGLCGVIFIAPYFFGGRHDFGRLVFVSLVAATAAAWFARQAVLPIARWPRTWAYVPMMLAVTLVALQIVPLPADWLARLAPRTGQLLPLWTAGGSSGLSLGTWQTLSLVPHETIKSFAMLLSYSLLFLVVIGRIEGKADAERLLKWIGASAALMAAFGLLQHFTSDGRFFWFYEHPQRSAARSLAGPFINRNHFADFLVMGIGPLVSWLLFAAKTPRVLSPHHESPARLKQLLTIWALAAATALVLLTILLSRSRGGTIALLVAGTVLVTIYLCHGLADSRFIYGLIALAVVVVGFLSIHGYDQVVERLDDFAAGSMDNIDHNGIRRTLWAANVAAFESGWLTGAGAGSHCEICPVYLPQSLTKEYTHAENGYLQIATETGIGGVLLLMAGLGLIANWCISAFRRSTDSVGIRLLGATAAGLAASAVHSMVDFVWYIPACMSVVIILAGCALRLSQMAPSDGERAACRRVLRRGRWIELTAATILIGAWTVHTFVGPGIAAVYWDRYLRASVAYSEVSDKANSRLVAGGEDASLGVRRSLAATMLTQLESLVYWDPNYALAHKQLANRYIAAFELGAVDGANALDVTQVRDAAQASSFSSPEQLQDWLQRAFGSNATFLCEALAHAQRAVELCPLEGDAYTYLADLAFLHAAPDAEVQAYIDQGLRVRPYDRHVLFAVGEQAARLGHHDEAIDLWARCFNTPGPHQKAIVYYVVTGGTPASDFLAKLHPDWHTLRDIWTQYRRCGQRHDLDAILSYAADETRREAEQPSGIPPACIWFWQSQLYIDVGQTDDSLKCLQHAYACDPRQYFIRYALGKALQASGRLAEAEPHYRWCLARRPADKNLSAALMTISKQRVAEREVATQSAHRKPRNAGSELLAPVVSSASH